MQFLMPRLIIEINERATNFQNIFEVKMIYRVWMAREFSK